MESKKMKQLYDLMTEHTRRLNHQIILISLIFITISIGWNIAAQRLNIPYPKAEVMLLAWMLVIWIMIFGVCFFQVFSPRLMALIVNMFMVKSICFLYFALNFHESWTYFLLIPIITSLYGRPVQQILFSLIGFILLFNLSSFYLHPHHQELVTTSDIYSRLLLYIIITSFSILLLRKMNQLYKEQATIQVVSLERMIDQIVKSFVLSVEGKDAYTRGHSERVSLYALEIGKVHHAFEEEDLKRLRLAALLHDIGKIQIPETILTSQKKLTSEEFAIMAKHPIEGSKMIGQMEELIHLNDGILYHHERWDGKGYPFHLKGEEIPLDGRIVAVVDAFDAMTSCRPYRSALGFDEAFERLRKGKGTQFDPAIIQLTEQVKEKWRRIYYDRLVRKKEEQPHEKTSGE
ncbi:HD-GYP domain-containing protein [Bacillus kexueae]|uniref:HD-GYP domain-containing protein n=1 Tax=Aeribacillus kexueae TaxID=2078952 RepID=UPI001FAFDA44|nr:HD-GYP domain-containing protein [Bacillus kexueae]